MFEIVEKRELAENIYLTRVKAPRIARSAQPGQFVIVRADKVGERTPLTIADYDAEEGTVTLVTQALVFRHVKLWLRAQASISLTLQAHSVVLQTS